MLFLREKIERVAWAVIVFGFIGVLIILRQGFDIFDIKSLLPLGAGFFFALYQVITKKASKSMTQMKLLYFLHLYLV